MKVQWKILVFMVCINLAFGIVVSLGIAGTEYMTPLDPSVDAETYEQHFNATDIAEGWSSTPFSGIPVIGDIFGAFNFLWQNIAYLVDGLPVVLTYLGDNYVTSSDGQLAFDILTTALRALYGILIAAFVIEFISGRIFHGT